MERFDAGVFVCESISPAVAAEGDEEDEEHEKEEETDQGAKGQHTRRPCDLHRHGDWDTKQEVRRLSSVFNL